MLTILISTIFNSQVFLLKNVNGANAKATLIFSAKILVYKPYLMIIVLTICQLTTWLVLNNWSQEKATEETILVCVFYNFLYIIIDT